MSNNDYMWPIMSSSYGRALNVSKGMAWEGSPGSSSNMIEQLKCLAAKIQITAICEYRTFFK